MVKFLDYFKCCVNIGVTIITIYIVFSSQYLFLNLSILDLIIVALLSAVLIFISFNILLARFYKNAPFKRSDICI